MPDTEHAEWLRDEEERKQLRSHPHDGAKKIPPPDDEVKKPAVVPDEDEAQEEVDDASDDAADELLADGNEEIASQEGEV